MSAFQTAFKDTYPSEDPILTSSSSPEDIIQELENSPQLYQGFSSKITEDKIAIRALARTAKH